jgi:hypothetical protein
MLLAGCVGKLTGDGNSLPPIDSGAIDGEMLSPRRPQ